MQLQGGGGGGVAGGASAVLQLEARLQALQISEAAALSRSEAAERVLADAQAGRRELAARLEEVEEPVAEARERLREAETTLAEANQQVAQLRAAADADGRTKPSWELEADLEAAKAEAAKAKDLEAMASSQATELAARQSALEDEAAQLRASLSALQQTSDDKLEMGQMQWALMQARQGEGDAKRQLAAGRARLHHAQAALYKHQLLLDGKDAQLFDSQQSKHALETALRHEVSELQLRVQGNVPLSKLQKITAQVNEHARRSEEAHREVRQKGRERDGGGGGARRGPACAAQDAHRREAPCAARRTTARAGA